MHTLAASDLWYVYSHYLSMTLVVQASTCSETPRNYTATRNSIGGCWISWHSLGIQYLIKYKAWVIFIREKPSPSSWSQMEVFHWIKKGVGLTHNRSSLPCRCGSFICFFILWVLDWLTAERVCLIFITPYILCILCAKALVSCYGDVPSHSTYCGSTLLREPVPGPL